MRPTTVLSALAAVFVALGAVGIGVYLFWDRDGGKDWFYWAAPLLSLAFGGLMAMLVAQYWNRVGKLEVKGRPRSG